jgi:ribosomal protein L7/L12
LWTTDPYEPPAAPKKDLSDLRELARGNKIAAIKLLRELHPGLGLKEVKEYIDSL